jgi:hypothetical protein
MSSIVFEMIGLSASETGLQFSFKYMFVDSSVKISRVKVCLERREKHETMWARDHDDDILYEYRMILFLDTQMCVNIILKLF